MSASLKPIQMARSVHRGTSIKRSRSQRLKSIEAVYNDFMKRKHVSNQHKSRHKEPSEQSTPLARKKRAMNPYQKFLKSETRKERYREMRGSERMCAIATAWDKKKREIERNKRKLERAKKNI